jgi:hypothetical protein
MKKKSSLFTTDNFDLKEFDYVDMNMKIPLPVLVLGIQISSEYPRRYRAKKKYDFKCIVHQTAGHGCHQQYVYGMILKPKKLPEMELLARNYYASEIGCYSQSLNDIIKYRDTLDRLFGVDCNYTYREFEEGFYPIDFSKENLEKLAVDAASIPDPDSMIAWKESFDRVVGCIGRWGLFILGENCD